MPQTATSAPDEPKDDAQDAGTGVVRAARGDGLNIPRDRLTTAIAAYTAEEQDLVIWLHGFAMDRFHGSRSALCDFIGLDWTTLYRVFTGKYGASLADICKRLRHLRARETAASHGAWVDTVVTRKICAAMDIARNQNCIVLVTGAAGRSKSESGKHWHHQNNHGASLYIDCPVGAGLRPLLDEVAERAGLGRRIPNSMLQDRLFDSFDYRHTLIFDEVARLLPAGARSRTLHPLEFIRRLNDVSHCGIVLIATRVFSNEMASGAWHQWFEQLRDRIQVRLDIPDVVSRQECAEIASAFTDGRPSADIVSLVHRVANHPVRTEDKTPGRVRMAFTILRHAAMLAGAKNEILAASHIQAAIDFRRNLNIWPQE